MDFCAVRERVVVSLMALAMAMTAACKPPEPRQPPLACVLEATPLDEADGRYLALAFLVGNPGREVEEGSYFQPFVHFALTARAGDRDVPVIKPEVLAMAPPPGAQLPAEERSFALPPGGGIRIPTPIRLRLNSGSTVPADQFVWMLGHEPAGPITLEANIDLGAAAPRQCKAEHTLK